MRLHPGQLCLPSALYDAAMLLFGRLLGFITSLALRQSGPLASFPATKIAGAVVFAFSAPARFQHKLEQLPVPRNLTERRFRGYWDRCAS